MRLHVAPDDLQITSWLPTAVTTEVEQLQWVNRVTRLVALDDRLAASMA